MEYVQPADFYRRAHQVIFQTMVDLNDQDEVIDVVTVNNRLTEQNQLEDVGGVSYIAELADAVPTAANVGYYAKIVQEKSLMRHLITTATNIVSQAYDQDDDVTSLLDNAERQIMEVSEQRSSNGFRPIRDVLNSAIEEVNRLYQKKRGDNRVTNGLSGLR